MSGKWFPQISPDGKRVACGNGLLYLKDWNTDWIQRGSGYGPVWIDDQNILYEGDNNWTKEMNVINGISLDIKRFGANQRAADGLGRWAVAKTFDKQMYVSWSNHPQGEWTEPTFGGGRFGCLNPEHTAYRIDDSLFAVGCSAIKLSNMHTVLRSDDGVLVDADSGQPYNVLVGVQEYEYCLIDTPSITWIFSFDQFGRHMLRPLGDPYGYFVDTITEGPSTVHGVCVGTQLRVVWGEGRQAQFNLSDQRVDLRRPQVEPEPPEEPTVNAPKIDVESWANPVLDRADQTIIKWSDPENGQHFEVYRRAGSVYVKHAIDGVGSDQTGKARPMKIGI